MKRIPTLATVILASLLLMAAAQDTAAQDSQDYSWQPDRPITIIVPWAAGGSTDQMTRILAADLEAALGQSVVVVNQPGASGSIGTTNALGAARDGYTWAAGAAGDLGTYAVLDMLDTSLEDWHIFLTVANVEVVGVNANTPYQDFGGLLEAMRERPDQISVATAGLSSAGHNAMEAISQATGVEYRHVTYDGGNPAVIATVSGETEVTTQLAVEQAEMIRGGRIRPLAVVSTEPLEIEGYDGQIPPITDWIPDLEIATNYFGIWVPRGVPDEVVETVERIWEERISQSEALRDYALERGALFTPYYGEEAQERGMTRVRSQAWTLFDSGQAPISPDTVGIERP
ncbi:MAG: tripartite tricarboxylate transporter substrate binding protein [Deinococcota bacterium]|jgi:tripartite-type tricarboxylate transporter receptor subunit TctC|nr:tripartite tricarboxylate transporter substrate binding protein [Deinococcota bacterium]